MRELEHRLKILEYSFEVSKYDKNIKYMLELKE